MLTGTEDLIIVLLTVAGSLTFALALNFFWPAANRSAHNEIIGWQLSILGTTYAVMLGFMLFTVWTNFTAAESNADNEANALLNVYRLAEGLPSPQREQLQAAARDYVDTVINQDWPEMAHPSAEQRKHHELNEKSHVENVRMWQIVMAVKTSTVSEAAAEDHVLTEISSMAEHRKLRHLESISKLPTILWFVLIVGGIVTIASSCLFGAASTVLHAVQISGLSLLIGLVLVAIGDIDRPFQGTVHVSDSGFLQAQKTMHELPPDPRKP